MAKTIDIIVPDLGDFEAVEVIEILVSNGDTVERENGLITLETDKAAMDVPSPENGVVEALTVAVGDTVSTGDVIGQLTVEVSDTVVIAPAIQHEPSGDTTVLAIPATADGAAPKSDGVQTLVVPDLGDFEDVEVIEVLVSNGDEIGVEDPLVTLETDKAAMDVPAIVAGRIESVLVKVGDKVSEGSSIAIIDAVAAASAEPPAPATDVTQAIATPPAPPEPVKKQVQQAAPRQLPPINEAGFSRAHASPSVRKLARELGVDLPQLKGSGSKNRILHDDLKAFVKAILTGQAAGPAGGGLPKIPRVDFSKFG